MMRALAITLVCLALVRTASAADPTLFRLYLTDGTTVVTYGEYVQVEDRVVFSMLMGGRPGAPRLQAVTLPASLIDWTRTGRDAASVRYQHYAQTRGEDDFLQLTNDVAGVLNDMLVTPDRARALEVAQRARVTLADWPRAHFGYRQRDVQEILAVLDESISALRAAAGIAAFDVALVASVPEVELVPLPAPSSLYDQIAQAFRVAGLTGRATERVALLQGALLMLHEAGAALSASDIAIWRRTAETQIRQEMAIDARYAALARQLMDRARRAAAAARVGDVQRVLNSLHSEDDNLGGRRPEVVQALRASIEAHLLAARELRLLRDQWEIRRALYREYQRMVRSHLLRLVRAEPALEAIRRLEGPSPDALADLRRQLRDGTARLEEMRPPSDLRPAHDALIGAWRFAERAVSGRLAAAASADLAAAWEASSSAAGALLLLSRAQQDIRALAEPPQLR